MQDFVGYNDKKIGFAEVTAATGGAAVPITAVIDVVIAAAPFLTSWISNVFSHPAADARGIIAEVKKNIVNVDARTRLATVLAAATKISPKAKDVEARELDLWYRQTYPNDYQNLTADDMVYWNNTMVNNANQYSTVNQAARDYIAAEFTTAQIASKNPVTALTSTTGKNYLLYGVIAIALFLIFRKK